MHGSDVPRDEVIRDIGKHGCCLGKYRALLDGTYYCYLADVLDCQHQEPTHVRKIGADMVICETARQAPCQSCERYRAAAAEARVPAAAR